MTVSACSMGLLVRHGIATRAKGFVEVQNPRCRDAALRSLPLLNRTAYNFADSVSWAGKMSSFLSDESAQHLAAAGRLAGAGLAARLILDRQVGDLLKLDYAEAVVVVHDHLKAKVGGLPLGAFLLSSRVAPGSEPDPAQEDTSLILL